MLYVFFHLFKKQVFKEMSMLDHFGSFRVIYTLNILEFKNTIDR